MKGLLFNGNYLITCTIIDNDVKEYKKIITFLKYIFIKYERIIIIVWRMFS
jgi:hypothetical protein